MIFGRRGKDRPAEAIAAFWAWWATGRARVERAIADGRWDDGLVAEFSARVSAIAPGLAWDFGAGTTSRHLLVVTADGDRALRATAERWLRAGPAPDATFAYAASRQAVPGLLESRLDIGGRQIELSGLLFAADLDEQAVQVDVRVWHPEFAGMPADARVQIAFLALDWLLGEDEVEIWIREIDATAESGPSLTAKDLLTAVQGLEPQWQLLSGERSGHPLVATVSAPLKAARFPAADLHVRVDVPYRNANPGGLPVEGSLAALRAFEDRVFADEYGPVLVAHETSNKLRTFHLYAERQAAADALEPLVASWPEGRVRITVSADPTWDAVRHLRA